MHHISANCQFSLFLRTTRHDRFGNAITRHDTAYRTIYLCVALIFMSAGGTTFTMLRYLYTILLYVVEDWLVEGKKVYVFHRLFLGLSFR